MGKKQTLEENKETIRLDLTGNDAKKLRYIKEKRGMTMNTQLTRTLIQEEFTRLGGQMTEARLEHINADENGVKIHDRELHNIVQVYFQPSGVRCGYDGTFSCIHIDFALLQPEVREIIRKRRKEGWKLPDV
jgi:hypothetical protein